MGSHAKDITYCIPIPNNLGREGIAVLRASWSYLQFLRWNTVFGCTYNVHGWEQDAMHRPEPFPLLRQCLMLTVTKRLFSLLFIVISHPGNSTEAHIVCFCAKMKHFYHMLVYVLTSLLICQQFWKQRSVLKWFSAIIDPKIIQCCSQRSLYGYSWWTQGYPTERRLWVGWLWAEAWQISGWLLRFQGAWWIQLLHIP